ncbi:outer membrane lipoprotein carrier protein LolA [Nannocystis sp.]|uniref:LolA family protein n=1 Tax=Nannocystis sp. TaxID=1962667 RepID=UPI002422E9C2|nr:outer membrane lipoprotein carrier protein LolA [Nannocystis sp.]MBK7830197.1 outer membrane lipoprotein carrier protein LolA [Nannocystis sp.]MBK9752180.1 outer membrane lipoprotein carrier protein LolA [Nannocystis sp.]
MSILSLVASFGLSLAQAAPPTAAPAAITQPAPAAEKSASAVLAGVQSFYDGTVDLIGKFRQTYVHQVYGTRTVSHGALKLRKPGMMVWDYDGAADPDFYVDGQKLSVVEHDTRQVVSQKVEGNTSLAGAMKFLFGGQKLIKDFKVRLAPEKPAKSYGMPGHTVIELKPKVQDPNYKTLLLVVDDPTGRVDAFVVRSQDNSTNHFVLTEVTTNKGLDAKEFKFKVPKGYVETKQ